MLRRALVAALLSSIPCTALAEPKPSPGVPRPLKEIEAQVAKLAKAKELAPAYAELMKSLGVDATCGDACKKVSTSWIVANLDADPDEERALAIVTTGDGECPASRLDVLVLDATGDAWVAADRTSLSGPGKLELSTANAHDAARKDLVLHADGQCGDAPRTHVLRVESFEHGRLEALVDSTEWVGTELVSYAVSTGTIELSDAKGKHALRFDPDAFAFDALPPYDEVLKSSVSKDTDDTLSTKQCAAPLGAELAVDCDVTGTVKLKVVVQNGKATGLTIAMTPPKPSVLRCLRRKVAAATWPSLPGVTGCTRTFAVK